PGHRGPRRRAGPQTPAATARQTQDQGGRRAAVGPPGVRRTARGPLLLDLAAARRRAGRAGPRHEGQQGDRPPGPSKNDIDPWVVRSWCIPPKADGEFVWRMEDVIRTYMLPYDPKRPVVCFDEASRQLFGEVRPPERARPGRRAKQDYEYERKGT